MEEGKENRNANFSFMQETIKQKKLYQNRIVRRIVLSMVSGVLFGLTALLIWALFLPKLDIGPKEQEI